MANVFLKGYIRNRINDLQVMQIGIIRAMDWATIRKAFKAARKSYERKQHGVIGVPQPMISKLEANDKLGPTVETFVKAVEGMGMSVSLFFARIEASTTQADSKDDPRRATQAAGDDRHALAAADKKREDEVVRTLARLVVEGERRKKTPTRSDRREARRDDDKTSEHAEHGGARHRRTPQRKKKRRPGPGRQTE